MRYGLKNKGGYVIIDELVGAMDIEGGTKDIYFDDISSNKLSEAARSGKLVIVGNIRITNASNYYASVTPCKFVPYTIEELDEFMAPTVYKYITAVDGSVETADTFYTTVFKIYSDGSAVLENIDI